MMSYWWYRLRWMIGMNENGMLTVTHAAATSGVPRRTILRAIALGHIDSREDWAGHRRLAHPPRKLQPMANRKTNMNMDPEFVDELPPGHASTRGKTQTTPRLGR